MHFFTTFRPPVEDVEVSRRIQDEKQAKAQLHRSRIQEEKTQKYKLVSDKVNADPWGMYHIML